MIIRIAQGLRGGDHDRLSRMDSQRVEILHVTYRDTVIEAVAHHLVLYLFPALQAFLHQYLRRERESLLYQHVQFFLIVAETGTQAPQRISGTDDDRIPQLSGRTTSVSGVLYGLALDRLHVDLIQLAYEQLPILGIHDSLHRGTQYLHAILLQHAALVKGHATIQRRLPAESEQDTFRTFLLDHLFHKKRSNGQEINRVRDSFRGLYRSDIRIDQYRLNPLFLNRLQGLAA